MIARTLASLAAALALAAPAGATAYAPLPQPANLVTVDVYDRVDRTALPVYEKDGRRYIVGTPGHEYAVRIRNCLSRRVLVVTSVDGVNVVTGETASPEQSGYVLEPFGSVEIGGWRKSLAGTAAFYFTDLGDSYAARTGRPLDVGVIGVAVFPERIAVAQPRIGWAERAQAKAEASNEAAAGSASPASPMNRADAGMDAPAAAAPPAQEGRLAQPAPGASAEKRTGDRLMRAEPAPFAPLGTGHGRYESAPAQQVRFDRESSRPAQMLSLQYDRRENLVAMGVLPPPVYANRSPNPFPQLRFAPDPR